MQKTTIKLKAAKKVSMDATAVAFYFSSTWMFFFCLRKDHMLLSQYVVSLPTDFDKSWAKLCSLPHAREPGSEAASF